ncbi:MAG: MFS transporter, partial [Propionibacteriales bacterium]|nr:MFS transporter [Propionibacteriales bacterium]
VALPAIVPDLGMGISQAQWVNSIYAGVFSALLLPAGRLGDRLGRRTTLLFGVFVFVGASVLASRADSASALIAARLVQGIGGAFILPSTLSTVNATFRGKGRAAAFGVWGAVMAGAAALGPLLGGWLTSSFDWGWIFLVNVPLGAIVLIGTVLVVPNTRGEAGELDLLGVVLSGLGLAALVFALIEGSSLGWLIPRQPLEILGAQIGGDWPISVVAVLIMVGLVLMTAFLLLERSRIARGVSPLLDLRLFSLATFSWGNLTAAMVAIGEFGLLFVLPLYLVNVLDLGILTSGLLLATMALGAFISGASARHLAARLGATGTVILGLGLELLGVASLAIVISTAANLWSIGGVLVVYGVGLGLASAQLTSTVLADVPEGQSGQGSATQSTVRQLGTALGASIAGAALSAGLATALATVTGPAAEFAQSVHDSAGSVLPALRARGIDPAVLAPLADAYASATQLSIIVAAFFLGIGLLGAVAVARVARQSRQD